MENHEVKQFNQIMRDRTFAMSVAVYNLFVNKRFTQSSRPLINQMIRSSTSVAANFRAAARSRSDAEFYSKICIVVEECDETQFWFDFLLQTGILNREDTRDLRSEVDELMRMFSSMKKKMREKQEKLK